MKKVLALVMTLILVMGTGTAVFAQSEPDEWAVNEVDYAAAEFLKTAAGGLDYKKEITREEFAIVALYLYAAVSDMELPEMSVENPFVDCNNPLVVTSYGLGLVKGVSENEFNPEANVTREQICVMLTRIAQAFYPQLDMNAIAPYLPALSDFADGDKVSDWAADSVKLMVMAGLIKGTDEGMINPLGNCTVQEALIIAKRAMTVQY